MPMAIAFKEPFTDETKNMRDSIDLFGKTATSVTCFACHTNYLLIYPSDAPTEQVEEYKRAVEQGMGECNSHEEWIELGF